MTDWTARRNDSESGSLRKDGRMSAKDRPVFFTDIPDPWAGRLAVASSVQWWEPPNPPRIRAHTEILDSLAPLVFDLLAEGWDARRVHGVLGGGGVQQVGQDAGENAFSGAVSARDRIGALVVPGRVQALIAVGGSRAVAATCRLHHYVVALAQQGA